ncbi:MAG: 4Fe-4S cluster-binding domain-containing protein, partial [Planctomycetia bacterium]|nr:4Fe-4S cluster-binding domain-containing protein [Planctomycetia bacterium]
LPTLVWQGEAVSDLDGKQKLRRTWDGECWIRNRKISDRINVVWAWAGWGIPGLGGKYGYEDKSDDRWPDQTLLSVHAPSTVVVDVADGETITVQPRMGKYLRSNVRTKCLIDGKQVCELQEKDSSGELVPLTPGRHTIEFTVPGSNGAAQTLLLFDDTPVTTQDNQPVSPACYDQQGQSCLQDGRTIGIEIITNSQCAKSCPGCNQHAFMFAHPDYEFTLEDAQSLLDTLDRLQCRARLFLSGGEPAMWKNLAKVMKLLRSSPRIEYTQIATSVVTEKNIARLKKHCDLVCCSIRADQSQWLTSAPSWLSGCRLWNQKEHVIDGPAVSQTDCACASQGVECCLIGKDVYACTLAASLQLQPVGLGTRWGLDNAGSCTLDEWIEKQPFAKIGTYTACRLCPNNRHYRESGTKVETFANEKR